MTTPREEELTNKLREIFATAMPKQTNNGHRPAIDIIYALRREALGLAAVADLCFPYDSLAHGQDVHLAFVDGANLNNLLSGIAERIEHMVLELETLELKAKKQVKESPNGIRP